MTLREYINTVQNPHFKYAIISEIGKILNACGEPQNKVKAGEVSMEWPVPFYTLTEYQLNNHFIIIDGSAIFIYSDKGDNYSADAVYVYSDHRNLGVMSDFFDRLELDKDLIISTYNDYLIKIGKKREWQVPCSYENTNRRRYIASIPKKQVQDKYIPIQINKEDINIINIIIHIRSEAEDDTIYERCQNIINNICHGKEYLNDLKAFQDVFPELFI